MSIGKKQHPKVITIHVYFSQIDTVDPPFFQYIMNLEYQTKDVQFERQCWGNVTHHIQNIVFQWHKNTSVIFAIAGLEDILVPVRDHHGC